MPFTLLTPPAKAKAGTFKISSVSRRGGGWHIQITIPSTEYTRSFGSVEALDVLTGDGSDVGKLMLRANPEGLFRPTGLKHCFLLRLPSTDDSPQIDLTFESPLRRTNGKGELVVELPEWAWKPGRWQEIQKARDTNARQQAVSPTTRKDAMARIGAIK